MDSSLPLDLSSFPPIFISTSLLTTDDLHEVEESLYRIGGRLTYDPHEALIFLSRATRAKRAAFDLRALDVWTEEVPLPVTEHDTVRIGQKRRRSSDMDTKSWPELDGHVLVLKLDWLEDCLKKDRILGYKPYLVYTGKSVPKPQTELISKSSKDTITYIKADARIEPKSKSQGDATARISSILQRSRLDSSSGIDGAMSTSRFGYRRRFGQASSSRVPTKDAHPPKLHRTTTSEFEGIRSHPLPDPPAWLSEEEPRPLYSCLRSTPSENPNINFISQLTKIKEARVLTLDEIGVRAYSTSIASLSAYPHRIISPLEIMRLPGCDQKIATLWYEWHESVSLPEGSSSRELDYALDDQRLIPIVQELEADADLRVLRNFFEIWGVGADTARRFYFHEGWKDLDDVIEFGWKSLNRVQQIGVKFYDEFQIKIPKSEVESIAYTILRHARKCRETPQEFWTKDEVVRMNWMDDKRNRDQLDPRDFVCVIVGGYRRGKNESGDVDVILSHRDERMTLDLITDVVASLESESFITHTLTLQTTTSDRGGNTLPFRADGGGHGFDSLDKAFCVWQDPQFDDGNGKITKNPNIHRRVDIIISSWRNIGAGVLGWSSGTTFQRDIRRWVKREKGWKFDSSGVRDRRDGLIISLEEPSKTDPGDTWQDRERRLMDGMGIGWRPASERCTG